MINYDNAAAPFDYDLDHDNPYLEEVPERFVAESDDDFEQDFGHLAEMAYDPDQEAYYADATHAQWG